MTHYEENSSYIPRWNYESCIESLALMGPDLGDDGASTLRQIAEKRPHILAPAIESPLTGFALAKFDNSLLVDIAEAYYIDNGPQQWYAWDTGIRGHRPPGFAPLASYRYGPFLAMLSSNYKQGVTSINRILNHASEHRVRDYTDKSHVSLTTALGDKHTYINCHESWGWYLGLGIGPYPCMSALQAVEFITENKINNGESLSEIVSILLKDAESLAMTGLVLGILVRHLDKAGRLIDPFLAEPLFWKLESHRVIQIRMGPRPMPELPDLNNVDRRYWELRDVAMQVTVFGDDERRTQLLKTSQELLTNAQYIATDGNYDALQVQIWADALKISSYRFSNEDNDTVAIHQVIDPTIEADFKDSHSNLQRTEDTIGIFNRYYKSTDISDISSEMLATDLAKGKELLAKDSLPSQNIFDYAPIAVAASAIELHYKKGMNVSDEDLLWSSKTVLSHISTIQPGINDLVSYANTLGLDSIICRALPFLLLPSAHNLRKSLGLDSFAKKNGTLARVSKNTIQSSSVGALMCYARGLDTIWIEPCSFRYGKCHHKLALDIVTSSLKNCVPGVDYHKLIQRRRSKYVTLKIKTNATDYRISYFLLSPVIRAYGSASIHSNCCQKEAIRVLNILLDIHQLCAVSFPRTVPPIDDYSLTAARAVLWQAVNQNIEPLLRHIGFYVNRSANALMYALRSISASAQENADAASSARYLWPQIMDYVLQAVNDNPNFWALDESEMAFAELIPKTQPEWAYSTLELSGSPERWVDLVAWSPYVEQWIELAVKNTKSFYCIDNLVSSIIEMDMIDQINGGLRWVESIVIGSANSCVTTFLLPSWLEEIQPHLTTYGSGAQERWQRIIGKLIVSGDTRVASLSN